jgi:hypothetical protein
MVESFYDERFAFEDSYLAIHKNQE